MRGPERTPPCAGNAPEDPGSLFRLRRRGSSAARRSPGYPIRSHYMGFYGNRTSAGVLLYTQKGRAAVGWFSGNGRRIGRPMEGRGVEEENGPPARIEEVPVGSGDLRVPDGRRAAVRLDPLEGEGRGRPAGEAARRRAPFAHGRGPGSPAGTRRQRLPVFRGVEPGGPPPWGVGPEGDGPLRPDRGRAS